MKSIYLCVVDVLLPCPRAVCKPHPGWLVASDFLLLYVVLASLSKQVMLLASVPRVLQISILGYFKHLFSVCNLQRELLIRVSWAQHEEGQSRGDSFAGLHAGITKPAIRGLAQNQIPVLKLISIRSEKHRRTTN